MPERQSEKYAREAREMLRKADLENRDATPEERGRIEELIARAEEARRSEEAGRDADAFAKSIGNSGPVSVYTDTTGSPGARGLQGNRWWRCRPRPNSGRPARSTWAARMWSRRAP